MEGQGQDADAVGEVDLVAAVADAVGMVVGAVGETEDQLGELVEDPFAAAEDPSWSQVVEDLREPAALLVANRTDGS
jgi:hypothetical protein